MDWTLIEGLGGPALVVAIVLGLTAVIRKTTALSVLTGWLPVVAAVTGAVAGLFVLTPCPWEVAGIAAAVGKGFLLGLMAAGGYDLGAGIPKALSQGKDLP